jgi:acyl-CoA reductase-like NAD-dependent aldehyde dehydrogenase
LKELITAVEQHSVGDVLDSNAVLGAVQNYFQFARVKDQLARLQANDLKIAIGLTEASNSGKEYFIPPAVMDNPLMIPESSLRSLLVCFSASALLADC